MLLAQISQLKTAFPYLNENLGFFNAIPTFFYEIQKKEIV